MHMKISKTILASLLLASAGAASAQQAAQPVRAPAPAQAPKTPQQLTPAQQALVARQDAEMAKAAAWVVQNVDKNNAAEVWRGASPVAKGLVTEQAFVAQVSQDRQKLGAVAQRRQVSINRAIYPAGGQVPAGSYVNVVYATQFANAAQPVRELVSFHLDDDKIWRVSGYSVR
jgi:glucose/arabinose dehydrogenase